MSTAAASSAADWQNKLLRADKIHADLLYIHTGYKRTYSIYTYIYIYSCAVAPLRSVFQLH